MNSVGGQEIVFDKLCVCTGAEPKLLSRQRCFREIICGLRDMDSAVSLAEKLLASRRVVIVGNGGIALELIHVVSYVVYSHESLLDLFGGDS
jgi:pyruvate/2-oxoglutarate dehydrogenase complex dihydrolipoamide dehydrogenase (E3) component